MVGKYRRRLMGRRLTHRRLTVEKKDWRAADSSEVERRLAALRRERFIVVVCPTNLTHHK
jgi:hypothetical protein